MGVRVIVGFDQPVLRQKAKRISRFDQSVGRLLDDLAATMLAAPGAGLSANQVGVALRACVVCDSDGRVWDFVNPEIVKGSGIQVGLEGCLSYPGWVGEVARLETVVVKAKNRHGREFRTTAAGFTARCFQHELDHLDGILFVDRLTTPGSLLKEDG